MAAVFMRCLFFRKQAMPLKVTDINSSLSEGKWPGEGYVLYRGALEPRRGFGIALSVLLRTWNTLRNFILRRNISS